MPYHDLIAMTNGKSNTKLNDLSCLRVFEDALNAPEIISSHYSIAILNFKAKSFILADYILDTMFKIGHFDAARIK